MIADEGEQGGGGSDAGWSDLSADYVEDAVGAVKSAVRKEVKSDLEALSRGARRDPRLPQNLTARQLSLILSAKAEVSGCVPARIRRTLALFCVLVTVFAAQRAASGARPTTRPRARARVRARAIARAHTLCARCVPARADTSVTFRATRPSAPLRSAGGLRGLVSVGRDGGYARGAFVHRRGPEPLAHVFL